MLSTTTSESMSSVLKVEGQLNDQPTIEDIAASIQQGKDEDEIIKNLEGLSVHWTDFKVEEWKMPCSSLNLIQLAILNRQRNLVEHLLIQYKGFMHKGLYLTRNNVVKTQESGTAREQHKEQASSLQVETDSAVPQAAAGSPQSTPAASQRPAPAPSEQQQMEEGRTQESLLVNHPLHLACWLGEVDIVKSLVRPAVSSEERKKFSHHQERSSPVPADHSRAELQDLMRSVCTITVDAAQSRTQTHPEGLPLELAVSSQSVACVKFLLSSVLLPWLSSQYYFMCVELKRKAVALHLACCFSAPKVVALLLPALSQEIVHCRDGQGQTPLHFAVWNGDTDTIRLLLENGADVNALTDSSFSCLHILYRSVLHTSNYEANTQLLLQYGADVNISETTFTGDAKSPRIISPLHVLVEEIVDYTSKNLNQNMSKSLSAYTQSKPVSSQCSSQADYLEGLLSCLRLLLEAGANPNFSAYVPGRNSNNMETPLELILNMSTARDRRIVSDGGFMLSAISLLMEFGASSKFLSEDGSASLMNFLNSASSCGPGCINLFCENGVSADAIGQGLLAQIRQHPDSRIAWNPNSLRMLANKMSVEGLRALSQVLDSGHLHLTGAPNSQDQAQSETFGAVVSPLYGNPVRRLRHMCKLVVLRHLGNKSCRAEALLLPDVVKSYLKAHDYN